MWILTNGINVGVTKIIGDAVHEEMNRRNSKSHFQKNHQKSDPDSRIVVIGVARQDLLNHGDSFKESVSYPYFVLFSKLYSFSTNFNFSLSCEICCVKNVNF